MDYQLLDTGNSMKLETVGPYRIVRPAPQAMWSRALSKGEWSNVHASYERNSKGGGSWQWRSPVDRQFDILYGDLALRIRLTDFGHLGLFPEQRAQWAWLKDRVRVHCDTRSSDIQVLNLFAYTGGGTLSASQAGARVVHVDAAKGVVDWARENATISHLQDRPIRWIVDDALKFVDREIRRGNRYQGIILDPPSFGRGPKGQVFKIENDILPLLEACRRLLHRDAVFVLYTSHTPGFTPLVMSNQLQSILDSRQGAIEAGEMTVADQQGRLLPSGTFARWMSKDS